MEIISRQEAKSLGLPCYFTGEPCKHGHISERRVSNFVCTACATKRNNEWHRKNRDRSLNNARQWKAENRERIRKYNREYYARRQREENQRTRAWKAANRDKINARRRERMRTEPEFRTEKVMRDLLSRTLRFPKNRRTSEILGYTPQELKTHLEKQFTKGMSWDNHGDWHIDHIVPVSVFVKQGDYDPAVINALPNLQPIWASQNFSKSDKRVSLF